MKSIIFTILTVFYGLSVFSQIEVFYFQNFDSVTVPILPEYWSGQYVQTSDLASFSPNNSVTMIGHHGEEPNNLLVSPNLIDLDNTKQIRFKAKTNNEDISLKVGVMDNPRDSSTFTVLQNFPIGTITSSWVEYTISLENYTGTGKYFAFLKGIEVVASVFIDDFYYELNPSNVVIDDFNKRDFSLYPNPTKDFIYIFNNIAIDFFTLYSTSGMVLEKFVNKSYIDISNYQNGVYFLKIDTKQGSVIKKIIKI